MVSLQKFFFVALIIPSLVRAQVPVLVEPAWLQQNLKQSEVVILQVNQFRLDYEKEHIPGSRFLWPGWLAPDSPEGNLNAPDPKSATRLLQNLGIQKQSHVIISYGRNELPSAARMFLTLEHLGLQGKVSLLNGGVEAWKRAGYAVEQGRSPEGKGNFRARPVQLLVDYRYVQQRMNDSDMALVDARLPRFFHGEASGNPRDGHIPGAVNIPFTELINNDLHTFISIEDLRAKFNRIPADKNETIAYCNSGQTASVVYVAGRALGREMRVYDGSMQEWSRLESCPVEKDIPEMK
jgi:thiosulfate/3-mercaptopyruvate sulfurtransferase